MVADVGIMPLNMRDFKDTAAHDFMFKAARVDADSLPISMKYVVLQSHYARVPLHTYSRLLRPYTVRKNNSCFVILQS